MSCTKPIETGINITPKITIFLMELFFSLSQYKTPTIIMKKGFFPSCTKIRPAIDTIITSKISSFCRPVVSKA